MSKRRTSVISGLLVGDELGLIKRITLKTGSVPSMNDVVTLNRDQIDNPSPDQSILSIEPFRNSNLATFEEIESSDSDSEAGNRIDVQRNRPFGKIADDLAAESSIFFLITSKPDKISIFNSMTNQFIPITTIKPASGALLIGAAPYNRNNIVIIYQDGTIITQNIEKELLQSSADTKSKAIKLLGIDFDEDKQNNKPTKSQKRKKKKLKTGKEDEAPKPSAPEMPEADKDPNQNQDNNLNDLDRPHRPPVLNENEINHVQNTCCVIFEPKWNVSSTCVTCFEVNGGKVALGGKNLELKVIDISSKSLIFGAKSSHTDWLGIKTNIWISDLTFIGPITGGAKNAPNVKLFHSKFAPREHPSLVATCSRTDSEIRIYNIFGKAKKPIWTINLKDSRFNRDSNPPSFTSITASNCPRPCAVPIQNLFLGTTMGRLLVLELRFNSRSNRVLGVFKGFGGGSVRDVSFIPNCGPRTLSYSGSSSYLSGNHKIISCSLDRFVRIHSFRTGSDPRRTLESKFYIKTRPSCIQAIVSSVQVEELTSDLEQENEIDEEIDKDGTTDRVRKESRDLTPIVKKMKDGDNQSDEDSDSDQSSKVTDDENIDLDDELGSDIDLNDFADTEIDVNK